MRLPVLFLSAAALALGSCGNSTTSVSTDSSSQVDPGTDVSDQDLESRIMEALKDAPKNGLTRDLFLKADMPAQGPERRQALLEAAQEYASALANGKVDPNEIYDVYTVPRPKADVSAGLKQALRQNQLRQWLASLAPQSKEYQALSDAFVQLVQRTPDLKGESIPATGKIINPGDRDPRVPAIARNLRAQGYLQQAAAPTGQQQQQAQDSQSSDDKSQQDSQSGEAAVFTKEMSDALKQWQSDAGLKADGIVGPNTVEQLNSGPKDRARQLAVAMERLRWLNRNPPATRIDVNTASSFLEYFRDGQKVDQRKVIVGQPGWATPQLGTQMYALVANPNWVVPDSIAKQDDLASKSQSWLNENNFSKKNGHWVQEPGPQSALGVVKFALKDDQAIYLHDTPAKSLFQQDNRHDSHGCVRVHGALQFAHSLANQEGIDSKFSQAMDTGEETQVQLPNEIPVRLLYHTAFLGEDGRVHYAPDVYGWDNGVATALGYEKKEGANAQKARTGGDYGP